MSIQFRPQFILCPLYFYLPRAQILFQFLILFLCCRQLISLKQWRMCYCHNFLFYYKNAVTQVAMVHSRDKYRREGRWELWVSVATTNLTCPFISYAAMTQDLTKTITPTGGTQSNEEIRNIYEMETFTAMEHYTVVFWALHCVVLVVINNVVQEHATSIYRSWWKQEVPPKCWYLSMTPHHYIPDDHDLNTYQTLNSL